LIPGQNTFSCFPRKDISSFIWGDHCTRCHQPRWYASRGPLEGWRPFTHWRSYYLLSRSARLPISFVDYGNIHSWIIYHAIDRLHRCQAPMLLQFSATLPLDDPTTNILIRSCTLQTPARPLYSHSRPVEMATQLQSKIPRKQIAFFRGKLGNTTACSSAGEQVPDILELLVSSDGGNGNRNGQEVDGVLRGLQKFFVTPDNCDENFAFAIRGQTVASIYIGAGLGKPTALSVIEVLQQKEDVIMATNCTVVQRCRGQRGPARSFGVAIDTTGDLVSVQKVAAEWAKGNCVDQGHLAPSGKLKINSFHLIGTDPGNNHSQSRGNSTPSINGTLWAGLRKRATCRHIKVVANDGCGTFWSLDVASSSALPCR
jgi:hypothetical protein